VFAAQDARDGQFKSGKAREKLACSGVPTESIIGEERGTDGSSIKNNPMGEKNGNK